MSYESILASNGFTLFDKCNCGGALTLKYHDHNQMKVYVYPKRGTFNMLKNNIGISTGKLEILESKITEFKK